MCEEGGCIRKFAKIFLIIVNIILLLAALLMLALGISLVASPARVIKLLESTGVDFETFQIMSDYSFMTVIKASGIFMIVLGGVAALVAGLGFFAACCENKCLLITYAVILIIIMLAEIALIAFAAVYNRVFQSKAEERTLKTLMNFGVDVKVLKDGPIDSTMATDSGLNWMAFQSRYQCCGARNSSDYQTFAWNRTSCEAPYNCPPNAPVPLSCCKLKNPDMKFENVTNVNDYKNYASCLANADPDATNTNGCTELFVGEAQKWIQRYGRIAIGIAAGIIGLEFILLFLTFFLCCTGYGSSNKYV